MQIDYIIILKWVGTILLAAFIAQFGKMFAEYLVKRVRNKNEKKTLEQERIVYNIPETQTDEEALISIATFKREEKIKKKKAKAEIKHIKKQKEHKNTEEKI